MSSVTEEGDGLDVAALSPCLDAAIVDAARAAGALEEGLVCNVLLRRFFGMNLDPSGDAQRPPDLLLLT
jgi:hypothetical protein